MAYRAVVETFVTFAPGAAAGAIAATRPLIAFTSDRDIQEGP